MLLFFFFKLNQTPATAKYWDVVAAIAWGNVAVLCAECEHLQIKHELCPVYLCVMGYKIIFVIMLYNSKQV